MAESKTDFGTISVKEFANSIGKPVSTIYSWKRNGNIPSDCFAQIGKCIFVRVEAMTQSQVVMSDRNHITTTKVTTEEGTYRLFVAESTDGKGGIGISAIKIK